MDPDVRKLVRSTRRLVELVTLLLLLPMIALGLCAVGAAVLAIFGRFS